MTTLSQNVPGHHQVNFGFSFHELCYFAIHFKYILACIVYNNNIVLYINIDDGNTIIDNIIVQ